MKKVLVILLLLSKVSGFSQTTKMSSQIACGVQVPPNYLQWRNSIISIQNLVSTLQHDTCLNKTFSIAFHLVMDSTNRTNVSPSDLSNCISNLNTAFKRICVQFVNCHVDSIPNYSYNNWTMPVTDAVVSPNWDLTNTINMYLPDSIAGPPAGYAYMPGGKNVIVVEKASITAIVPIHEMGHFFGLNHTFAEINSAAVSPSNPPTSQEYVDRLNCYVHGDGFCDTEADPYAIGYDKKRMPCNFKPGPKDGYGKYYVPPVDNYMTYFTCNCRFTQEQYNFMARVILKQRLYLH